MAGHRRRVHAPDLGDQRRRRACWARAWPRFAAGDLAAAAGAGFTFIPETGLVTAFICIAGILAYGASYAATHQRQARNLSAADQERRRCSTRCSSTASRSRDRSNAYGRRCVVTEAISSSIGLQVVLDAVVRHAGRVAGADAGIVEVEAGATVFRSLAHQNLSPGFHEKLAGIRVDTQDRVIREAIDGKSRCRCLTLTRKADSCCARPPSRMAFTACWPCPSSRSASPAD
ncbi:MAG: hypothetical protein IPI73_07550 [Betaproteobacteria bacterium]|nr:hypothetical protein [Betaproteobacteria bacterium]